MSAVDLILLGLVYEQPQSAYDMQKHVEYRNLSRWVKISSPSIYKNVLKLEEKGCLTSEPVREGRMPEKTVYSITPAGREYFFKLMREKANAAVSVVFDFNAVIANLNKIENEQAMELAHTIRASMEAGRAYIAGMQPQRQHVPFVGRSIMDQQVQVYDALLKWMDSFLIGLASSDPDDAKKRGEQE